MQALRKFHSFLAAGWFISWSCVCFATSYCEVEPRSGSNGKLDPSIFRIGQSIVRLQECLITFMRAVAGQTCHAVVQNLRRECHISNHSQSMRKYCEYYKCFTGFIASSGTGGSWVRGALAARPRIANSNRASDTGVFFRWRWKACALGTKHQRCMNCIFVTTENSSKYIPFNRCRETY